MRQVLDLDLEIGGKTQLCHVEVEQYAPGLKVNVLRIATHDGKLVDFSKWERRRLAELEATVAARVNTGR